MPETKHKCTISSLDNIKGLIMSLILLKKDDDIDGLNVIHITGTKGKGSTCAFIESILRQSGLRTGLFR